MVHVAYKSFNCWPTLHWLCIWYELIFKTLFDTWGDSLLALGTETWHRFWSLIILFSSTVIMLSFYYKKRIFFSLSSRYFDISDHLFSFSSILYCWLEAAELCGRYKQHRQVQVTCRVRRSCKHLWHVTVTHSGVRWVTTVVCIHSD